MKRFFVLMIGVLFLSVVNSTATQLENIGIQVEMSYNYHGVLVGNDGPRRSKGQQPICPISIFVNSAERNLTFVGLENSMTVSYIITDELGQDIMYGSISNDSTTIDISDLTEGSYTLNVVINDICFIGRFDIETEIL